MWDFFVKLTGWLWGIPLLIAITLTGIIFSVRSKFFQFRYFGSILTRPFKKDPEIPDSKQKLTPFQAVSIAIGGSVGVSNISGVGTAIATGGPGALFWLWIAALLGMIIKMAEVTLAVYYRSTDKEGNHFGGPTYYMEKGLGIERGFKGWKVLAVVFGRGIFITFFITLQNYTVAEAVGSTFGINYMIPSIAMVILVYAIILGGLKKVGLIASYLVPFMCLFYLVCVLIVLLMHLGEVPGAFAQIFRAAFTGQAAMGGFLGATVTQAIRLGFARSVYSNEAGWGTSPMVHATAETNHPVKQGMMGAFEVFVDTLIVCTATGLLVIVTGLWNEGLTGATLTLTALEQNIGGFARIVVAFSIFLFGLTTATGWYTYYYTLLNHAFKDGKKKELIMNLYNYTVPLPGMILTLITIYVGSTPAELWTIADFSSVIPTFVNVVVVLVLGKQFIALLKDYEARYNGRGTVDPNFKLFFDDRLK